MLELQQSTACHEGKESKESKEGPGKPARPKARQSMNTGSQGVGELQEAWTADKERMTEGSLETSNAGGFVARCSLAVLKEKVLVDVEAASGEVAI